MSRWPLFAKTVTRLDEIPGIGVVIAQVIMAEVGVDMTGFPTPDDSCPGPGSRPGSAKQQVGEGWQRNRTRQPLSRPRRE